MNLNSTVNQTIKTDKRTKQLRKSSQYLMPSKLNNSQPAKGEYDIYPVCPLGSNKIFNGYRSLAKWIVQR